MDLTADEFKKRFPNLAKELEQNKMHLRIDSVRSANTNESLSGYIPNAVDFLRRCDKAEEAEAIINFLLKRGEISRAHADKLRDQLHEKGVRSFGTKKEDGYYFR